ncbi:MAG: tetratricopeptide repeat protein [Flavobacteriales bacterium]|nr:tetratricopeptide repeat protein [Flavobacteriales bacterium]
MSRLYFAIIFFFLCIYGSTLSFANEQADSILNTFSKYGNEEKIIKTLDYLSKNPEVERNFDVSLPLSSSIKKIAIESRLTSYLPIINKSIGRILYFKSEYNQANEIFLDVLHKLPMNDNNKVHRFDIYNFLGLIQRSLGNYDQATLYFFQSLEIATQLKDLDKEAVCYTNIGGIYYYQDNYKKSLENFEKAKQLRILLKDSAGVAGLENNLGAILLEESRFNEALQNFKQSYSFYKKNNIERNQVIILNNIARCHVGLSQYSEALNYLYLSLLVGQKIGYNSGIINANYLIGDVYQAQKKYLDALLYYKKSMDIARENQLKPLIRDLYKKMAETESLLKNFDNAYKYHILYAQYQDSIVNENTNKQIAEIQEKYESEKKEKEIESLSKEKLLQEIEINKKKVELDTQKNIRNYSFIGIGILTLSFFLLYRIYSNKKKNALILEEKNKEIESKNKDITDSIQYASLIQNAILPSLDDFKKVFPESFILYKPKDIVAGDFYWMIQKENSMLFAAADCTGHGVPGAMVSVVCSNALNRVVNEFGIEKPSEILNKTRELVIEHFTKSGSDVRDGMDISICKLFLNSGDNKRIEWAGANNPLWIYSSKNKIQDGVCAMSSTVSNSNFSLCEIPGDKQPIGKFIQTKPFSHHELTLEKGDTIFLFTDGFADQFGGEKGKKLKTSNFKQILLSIQSDNMDKQKELLNNAFESWKGNLEQVDDVCVMGIRI